MTGWYQLGADIDGEEHGDESGRSLSISGDGHTVIVGSPDSDGGRGVARVYRLSDDEWVEIGEGIVGELGHDRCGHSVAVNYDGSIVVIGGPDNTNPNNVINGGNARVYQLQEGHWTQLGHDIDAEGEYDRAGWAVAMSADGLSVAVGAPRNQDAGSKVGHARTYRYDGEFWMQVGDDIDGEAIGDQSGEAIAMSHDGNTVAVGARLNDGGGTGSGHVRVFRLNAGTWGQIGGDIDGESAGDRLGHSVAMNVDGTRVVIGAPENDSNGGRAGDRYGHARVYSLDSGSWIQTGEDLDGPVAKSLTGSSVSMSADGAVVIIGSPSTPSGVGKARGYELQDGAWVEVAEPLSAEEPGDHFGFSVSMSFDGKTVAVAAPLNNDTETNDLEYTGHVQVWQRCE